MMRIVSLLASGTEIVCALGAGEWLVGRSHECDNPAWVRTLPPCTRPAFDIDVSSGAIDAEVRRRIASGEPLYHVDTDLIQSLAPDLLITQLHCAVCAVTPDDVARAGGTGMAQQVLALSAGSVGGIYEGIRRVADALGRPEAAAAVIDDMQGRIRAVSAAVQHRPVPTVVVLEWTEPIFATGNWGPELVEAAGGLALLSSKDQYSTAIPWARVLEADPEYLVVAPCGFGLERTLQEVALFEALPGWFELRAVRDGHVAFADGNTYFNRSGTTIVDTVEILADILHGERFAAPGQGTAWWRYERRAGVRSERSPHLV